MNLPTRLQIQEEIYKRSYYKFFIDAFKILEPETDFQDNWHIKYICDLLQKEVERIGRKEPKTKDLIINIPPRSLKSSLITIIFNAWIWTKYPYIQLITASYSNELSVEHSVRTRRLIESEWYQNLFGETFKLSGDQNVKSKFENNKGGSRRATSVGSGITGSGADIIIVDDPLKVQDATSEIALKNATDWWTKTMYSRLNDQKTGLRIIVMQRLNEMDLTGEMLTGGSYELIRIPAELSEEVTPETLKQNYVDNLFFPKRFNKEVLGNIKQSIGSLAYSGQYEQRPNAVEGNLIKSYWFKYFHNTDLPDDVKRNFRTDSAYGKEGSDNSATICYSVYESNLYIWNVWDAQLEFPDFIKSYKDFLINNKYDNRSRCYFEPKASGLSIIQQLKNEFLSNSQHINIIEGEAPVDSKITRVSSASSTIEAGRVFLLSGSSWSNEFISECSVFPNGRHDDAVDVLSAIINEELLVKNEFAFAFS